MPDIKYVVLSDMHLGAENSLLTDLKPGTYHTDTMHPSPVLIQLAACLKELISKNSGKEKPKLILNGDLIELALTTTNRAAMAFQRFVELIFPEGEEPGFDKEIIFIAGNHDHHLWETARTHYYWANLKKLKPGEFIPSTFHITNLFSQPHVQSVFLTNLIHAYPHLQHLEVKAMYPGYAIKSFETERVVIFSHGQYVESMYSLMTTLRNAVFPDRIRPVTFRELEIENFAWIDFFWSTLGRSGSVGKDIELIYDKIQDASQIKSLIRNIAASMTRKNKNFIMRWLERKAIEFILRISVGRLADNERNEPDVDLTPDALEGLKRFLEVQLHNQLKIELKESIPHDVTFIFGHTHKPFHRYLNFNGYPKPVKVYNTGGWVVDTVKKQPLHGGSVVLVDEHLDTISLQFYKEGKFKIEPEEALLNNSQPHNNLFDYISKTFNFNAEPWTSFEKIAADEVENRYQNLKTMIAANKL